MITVNCNDILPIQHELLIFVSDDIGAIPVVKHHEFVLSPIENDEQIPCEKVITSIKEYLHSISEINNFDVVANSNTILIKSINGKKINKVIPPVKSIHNCCGL